MPVITDLDQVRTLLNRDRAWCAYALGDLAPGFREHAEWHALADRGEGLLLVYRGFSPPVVFGTGSPGVLDALLDEIQDPRLTLSVLPDVLPSVEARYRVENRQRMVRMLYSGTALPSIHDRVARLGPHDTEALLALYADGKAAGEAPDFFAPAMLEDGVFFGVREGDVFLAVAGTHLVAPSEGVAAVGNVYTRRDRRGNGLGAAVTAAVTGELAERGIRMIVLNVAEENGPARRVYSRLGYKHYCEFYEGLAVRA